VIESVRLIVFDLDGTLVDSRRDLAESVNALIESCGAPPFPEERVGRMVGDGAATLVARAFEAAGIAAPRDALERFLGLYNRRLLQCTRPYRGVTEMLEAIRARAALAVLTNKPLAATREILEGLNLAKYFPDAAVLGGDGPLARKPDPAGLQQLVAQAGVAARETLMVGDSIVDWRTARAASTLMCVARYGFGFESFPVEQMCADDYGIDEPIGLLRL
jgi:phosphoglycolate phosphatase